MKAEIEITPALRHFAATAFITTDKLYGQGREQLQAAIEKAENERAENEIRTGDVVRVTTKVGRTQRKCVNYFIAIVYDRNSKYLGDAEGNLHERGFYTKATPEEEKLIRPLLEDGND